MLCQYCNKNEAEYHFLIQFGYGGREVHLCAECADRLGRQYLGAMNSWGLGSAMNLFGQNGGQQARRGELPPELGEDFQRRRRIGELQARLDRAVEAEDYEAAAALRDEIRREQRATPELESGPGKRIPIN